MTSCICCQRQFFVSVDDVMRRWRNETINHTASFIHELYTIQVTLGLLHISFWCVSTALWFIIGLFGTYFRNIGECVLRVTPRSLRNIENLRWQRGFSEFISQRLNLIYEWNIFAYLCFCVCIQEICHFEPIFLFTSAQSLIKNNISFTLATR